MSCRPIKYVSIFARPQHGWKIYPHAAERTPSGIGPGVILSQFSFSVPNPHGVAVIWSHTLKDCDPPIVRPKHGDPDLKLMNKVIILMRKKTILRKAK